MRFVQSKRKLSRQCGLASDKKGFIQERTATYNRLAYLNLALAPHKALMLCVMLFLTRGNSASTG
jgi:hypothetical protein